MQSIVARAIHIGSYPIQNHEWNKNPRRMDPNNQDLAKGESSESKTLRAHTCAMHP